MEIENTDREGYVYKGKITTTVVEKDENGHVISRKEETEIKWEKIESDE